MRSGRRDSWLVEWSFGTLGRRARRRARPTTGLSVALALALAAPAAAAEPSAGIEGIRAYYEGRPDVSAVLLKAALFDPEALDPALPREIAAYLLGRSWEELGLRGLALHYLGEVEATAPEPWAGMARVGIGRMYFRDAEFSAVRSADGLASSSPEGRYLVGMSAFLGDDLDRVEALLMEMPEDDPHGPYARYARAQVEIARDRLDGARDLAAGLEAAESTPEALRNRARVLLGWIELLSGRDEKAKEAFSSASGAGVPGREVINGLLLTGARLSEVATVPVRTQRTEDAAIRMAMRAIVAEESDEKSRAALLRERLRREIRARKKEIDSLLSEGETLDGLIGDVARFDGIVSRDRWRRALVDEDEALPKSLREAVDRKPPGREDGFAPSHPVFHSVREHARVDPWLHQLLRLHGRIDRLGEALDEGPDVGEPAYWKVWKSWRRWFEDGEEADRRRRTALALLAVREWNLRSRVEDLAYVFGRSTKGEMAASRQERTASLLEDLEDLYVGAETAVPEDLESLERWIDYVANDVRKLLRAIPERSTDRVVSLLGNAMDHQARLRRFLIEWDVEPGDLADVREPWEKKVRDRVERLRSDVESLLVEAMEPVVRAELAVLTRLEADNEAALARLFAEGFGSELPLDTEEDDAPPEEDAA